LRKGNNRQKRPGERDRGNGEPSTWHT
jgi:hypothetical protein